MWRISDGTVIHLGGNVEGPSAFAQRLRALLADPPVGVQTTPIPGPGHDLDVNDVALMNAWVDQEASRPYLNHLGLEVTERPEDIPPLPLPEGYDPDDVGDVDELVLN